MSRMANPLVRLAVLSDLSGCGAWAQEAAPGAAAAADLHVRRVLSLEGIEDVSDLALVGREGPPALLIAGTCGGAEVDLAREAVLRTQRFELPCPPYLDSRIVDMDADGSLELARFTSGGWWAPRRSSTAMEQCAGRIRRRLAAPT